MVKTALALYLQTPKPCNIISHPATNEYSFHTGDGRMTQTKTQSTKTPEITQYRLVFVYSLFTLVTLKVKLCCVVLLMLVPVPN